MSPISMSSTMKAATLLLLPFVYAAPAFPPPAELTQGAVNANISLIAGGALPNNTAAVATGAAITGLQLLASLENIEAFFYSDAIQNLTSGAYTTGDLLLNDTMEIIAKIAAVCLLFTLCNPLGSPVWQANMINSKKKFTLPLSALFSAKTQRPWFHHARIPSRLRVSMNS